MRWPSIFKGEMDIVVAVLKLKAMWREGRKMGHVESRCPRHMGFTCAQEFTSKANKAGTQEEQGTFSRLCDYSTDALIDNWAENTHHVTLICQCRGPSRTRCPRRPTQQRQILCPQRKQVPLAALPPGVAPPGSHHPTQEKPNWTIPAQSTWGKPSVKTSYNCNNLNRKHS